MIPNIGQVVLRPSGLDWVAQVRIGDEQSVLIWGAKGKQYERFNNTDEWKYIVLPYK